MTLMAAERREIIGAVDMDDLRPRDVASAAIRLSERRHRSCDGPFSRGTPQIRIQAQIFQSERSPSGGFMRKGDKDGEEDREGEKNENKRGEGGDKEEDKSDEGEADEEDEDEVGDEDNKDNGGEDEE
ncbi:Hypothetical predicted protein [Xyrichtys novacula]|uniref:Uncharacterized protein n=1 Tax=Xyrichtys novacula TaxID=13765 RepID=A0AAV1GHW0_XYRNO|nr:Hypothetical predicted protein [Xyrichtys novacula]